MMRNRLVMFVLVLFLSPALAGCLDVGGIVKSGGPIPDPLPMSEDMYPMDARVVAAAVEAGLCGASINKAFHVSFSQGINLAEKDFKYDGFDRKSHKLLYYKSLADGSEGKKISGLLEFEDRFGRIAKAAYIAEYEINDKGLLIRKASAAPIFAMKPRVEIFLIPAGFMTVLPANKDADWEWLYESARESNVLGDPPDELLGEKNGNIIMAFFMDRTAPSSGVIFRVADKQSSNPRYGWGNSSEYVDLKGWRVSAVGGDFVVAANTPFFLKIYFTPGKEAGSRSPRLLLHKDMRTMK